MEFGECGFYWYSKNIDGLKISYHFYDQPVSFGKSLEFPLDTVCINFSRDNDEQSCLQAIKTMPIDTQYIQQKLAKYHFTVERIIEGKDSLFKELVFRAENNKQISGGIDFRLNEEQRLVTRFVDIGIKNEKDTTTNTSSIPLT